MKNNRFETFINKIYATQAEEISCTECFERVSRFVEQELSGGDPRSDMPGVAQHLSQCSACHEEYETLRDLRSLEDQGGLPSIEDLRDSIR